MSLAAPSDLHRAACAALFVTSLARISLAKSPARSSARGSVPASTPTNAPSATPRALEPFVLVEGDYRAFSSEAEGYAGFALRRARMGLRASVNGWLEVRFVGEYARSTVAILDAFATIQLPRDLELNVGYLRMPTMPSGRDDRVYALAIPERPIVVSALWPGRDLGLEAHWAPRRLPVELWTRIGNGAGNPLGPDGNAPTVALRFDVAAGRAHAHGDRANFFGLRLGAAVLLGSVQDRPGIAGSTPLGFSFARAVPIDGLRVNATAHVRVYLGPVRLSIEGGVARDARSRDNDGDPGTPRTSLAPVYTTGGVLEAAWMLTGHHRTAQSDWPVYERASFLPLSLGAIEFAARVERLALGIGADDVAPAGTWAFSAALRWWINRWAALSIAGYAHVYDRAPLEAPDTTQSYAALLRGTVRAP